MPMAEPNLTTLYEGLGIKRIRKHEGESECTKDTNLEPFCYCGAG